MHKIGSKFKILTFFLNFDLTKGGGGLQPLSSPPLIAPLLLRLYFQYWAIASVPCNFCFRNNLLKSVPRGVLKSLPNLKTLLLQRNSIDQIRGDDFRFNAKLEVSNLLLRYYFFQYLKVELNGN